MNNHKQQVFGYKRVELSARHLDLPERLPNHFQYPELFIGVSAAKVQEAQLADRDCAKVSSGDAVNASLNRIERLRDMLKCDATHIPPRGS